MVVRVAAQERHLVLGPVGDAQPQHLAVEGDGGVDVGGVEHGVRHPDGHRAVPATRNDRLDLGADLDETSLGVGEPQPVAAAGLVQRTGPEGGDDAACVEAPRGLVDLGRGRDGEREAAESDLLPLGQVEDVVLVARTAQPAGAGVGLDGLQAPDLFVEVGGLGEGRGVQLDVAK